jgi:hypothetical protein
MSVPHLSNKIYIKFYPKSGTHYRENTKKSAIGLKCKKSQQRTQYTVLRTIAQHFQDQFEHFVCMTRIWSRSSLRALSGLSTERHEKMQKKQAIKNKNKNSQNSGQVRTRRSRHACSTNSTRQYLSLFRTSIAEPADFAPRSEGVLEVSEPIPIQTAR